MKQLLILVLIVSCKAPGGEPAAGWKAGVAKVKITPETPGWLTGYGNRNKPAEGVTMDLWARALALEDSAGTRAVIVAADILGFPPPVHRKIRDLARRRYGLAEANLLLVASHTHAGPAMPSRPSMEIFHGFNDETGKSILDYAEWLQGKVLEAVGQALSDLRPSTLGTSSSQWPEGFAINRRLPQAGGPPRLANHPGGVTDPELRTFWVHRGAQPAAVAFTYACHCTTLGGDYYRYHGDWAGAAAEAIERRYSGAVALFVTGCGGDINPNPRGKVEMVADHGRAFLAAVERQPSPTPVASPLRTHYRPIELPLAAPPTRELLEKLTTHKSVFRQRHAREMLKFLDSGKMPAAVPYPLQVWHFGGDLTLAALPGEVCVEYSLRLKKELGPNAWVAGYANEVPCYIPSEKVLAEGGYEAGWDAEFARSVAGGSMIYYGWPAPFAPGVEDRIVGAVRAMK